MNDQTQFFTGDIVVQAGECYQVIEDLGGKGRVRHFPSDEEDSFVLEWQAAGGTRCIGNEPLPAPSPCATGDGCPTQQPRTGLTSRANLIACQG